MGLIDTVVATVRCPTCGGVAEREVQFKHEACMMGTYRVGDFVPGAPAGQPLLRGYFGCTGRRAASPRRRSKPEHGAECWVHFDRGFLTAVTTELPGRPTEVAWWMLERAGADAAELRGALRAVESVVKARRETRKEPKPPKHPLLRLWRVVSEDALLSRLDEVAKRARERAWPGGEG